MNGRGSWGLDLKANSIILTYINALIPFVSSESGLHRINCDISTNIFAIIVSQISVQVSSNPAANELFIAVDEPVVINNIYLHHILSASQPIDNLEQKRVSYIALTSGVLLRDYIICRFS